MKKNILVLNANPNKQSYTAAIAKSYTKSAKAAGHSVTELDLVDLDFDYNMMPGSDLEPDLLKQHELIKAADHIVITTPLWWGTYPAVLKAYFDRVFINGFAYGHPNPNKWLENLLAVRLLKGKTARVFVVQDQYRIVSLLHGNPFGWNMRLAIFFFVGINKSRYSYFTSARRSTDTRRQKFLAKTEKLAKRAR